MKVSKKWLQKYFEEKLPDAIELATALTFHAFEIDGMGRIGLDNPEGPDDVLDVKVTPNRGHDALSHRGIAKELSAILKIPFAHDPFNTAQSAGGVSSAAGGGDSSGVSVKLSTPLCKRYIAAYIKGVKVAPSPKWLAERLEAIGQRPINNVVDATNFVMFNTGQPLHAFDAKKLGSLDICVRAALPGEQMVALDDKVYTLSDSMLVITAGDRAVGIAGVKGGKASGIGEETTDIIVESANFDGVTTRKTAQVLKLRTDASARFEQVISPELCMHGINGMLEFVQNVCGGELVSLIDVYPAPQEQTFVSVTVEQVNQLLGVELTSADIADVFVRLGLPYKEQEGVFEVQPPAERLDLVIAEDLIEEVGRIIGYDRVPATPLPAFPKKPEINAEFYAAEKVREELLGQGYSEVLTSVFAEAGERTVLNKVDGVKPFLRSNLQTGLLEAWNKNAPNKDLLGLKEVKIFEIGTVWTNGKEEMHVATVDGKGNVEEKKLEPLPADAYENFSLSTASQYKPFSRYPYIVRDVAFWIPAGTDEGVGEELIKQEAGGLCVKISLFDRFQKPASPDGGGDKTSLAFRLIFQSFDRTLTEVEVNQIMQEISRILVDKGFEVR
jgi:phenylalanyl-tRNA synthetase beta chain